MPYREGWLKKIDAIKIHFQNKKTAPPGTKSAGGAVLLSKLNGFRVRVN
jgi:hypothetical protein